MPAQRPEISLCLIVLNEEPMLRRALENAGPHVDEIVVVDGGSQDRTETIASDLGAHVWRKKWAHHYGAQRNYCLAKANGEWVLFMDADETFERSLLTGLRGFAKNRIGIDMFGFPRKTFVDGRLCPDYPDRQLRLFRNNGRIKYVGRVHEKPEGYRFAAFPLDRHIIQRKSAKTQTAQSAYYRYLIKKYRIR